MAFFEKNIMVVKFLEMGVAVSVQIQKNFHVYINTTSLLHKTNCDPIVFDAGSKTHLDFFRFTTHQGFQVSISKSTDILVEFLAVITAGFTGKTQPLKKMKKIEHRLGKIQSVTYKSGPFVYLVKSGNTACTHI